MARIAGVDIPREKRVVISLTYIYGIGLKTAQQVLKQANVSEDTRVKDLSNDELDRIREIIDGLKVEGDLRREISLHQASPRNRFLPWLTSPSWLASSWSKHQEQRSYT